MTEPLDLDAIKARLEAATPGPWRQGSPDFRCTIDHDGRGGGHGKGECLYTQDGWDDEYFYYVYQDRDYADSDDGKLGMIVGFWGYDEGGIRRESDSDLIANAPEDIAALLAEVDELQKFVGIAQVMYDLLEEAYNLNERGVNPVGPLAQAVAFMDSNPI